MKLTLNKVFKSSVFTVAAMGILFTNMNNSSAQTADLTKYVNPFIGTAKMGHTFPGATVPFGAVQLSPDTDTIPYALNGQYNPKVYEYCAGYKWEDKTIVGFSHTHFNGTGHSDLGDILIMPTQGELRLNPGQAGISRSGYRQAFSHDNEHAEPGYYSVKLKDDDIDAQLSATTRVGIHNYKFNKAGDANVVVDLVHGIYNYDGKNVWTYVRVVNDSLITGYRQTNGWARTRTVYFAIKFSRPFSQYGKQANNEKKVYRGFWGKFNQNKNFPELADHQMRLYFTFNNAAGDELMVKCAISPVSQQNAVDNMNAEAPGWNFNTYRQQAKNAWQNELQKIKVTASEGDKTNFYTAMYHTLINPTVYSDVNGEYKGLDQNVHKLNAGEQNYTTFSLWDTYRALHPWFNLMEPKRSNDMVASMLRHYKQFSMHMLPIWSHYANENWCMSGYHAVSVASDAVAKGVYTGNANELLDACIATSNKDSFDGVGDYKKYGYIPAENSGVSVSNVLEYAYDDWAIARLAERLGRKESAEYYKRSGYWKNVFDPKTGFMRPKLANGQFKVPFDPLETSGQGFIEGNAWNFSFYVPQDVPGLIKAMGGKQAFVKKLDKLFGMHLSDEFFAHTEDISREGIVGGYVHGNEPSHQIIYMYNYAGAPHKAQAMVRRVLNEQYKPKADGLGGNDDCGQMSAWYLFSSLGFYPVCPGSTTYSLGSPVVDAADLKLENGKILQVRTQNQGADNVYVSKVTLKGKALNRLTIEHNELLAGGELKFYMSSRPNK